METGGDARGRRPISLGTKITIGLVAGIAVGVFLGERSAPLNILGRIYVSLLQMTVLPYVIVSLIAKIGSLTIDSAKRLAGRAGLVLLAFWAISLAMVFLLPLSLPKWDAGTFFSASLVERPAPFDFIDLYLPTNPFHSIANNIVPATVLFSILLGVALISIPAKARVLEPFLVIGDALGVISGLIMRLAPVGTFALTAGAAGSLSPAELAKLMGYVGTYTFAVVLLGFVVLPALVAAVTPYRMLEFLKGCRSAIMMAFATSKLFAVLPMIIDNAKDLLVYREVPEEEARTTADMLVPLAYPFPNAGRVVGLLFIPFAAWYSGQALDVTDYPMLLTVGLLAFFGSPVAALPFLLDMFRLPADLFPLFLISGIWCARLGDTLGAVHLAAFTVITSAWSRGVARIRLPRLAVFLVLTVVATGIAMVLNNLVIKQAISGQEPPVNLVAGMELRKKVAEFRVVSEPGPNPVALEDGETHLERIRRAGILRVGYVVKNPPFSYRTSAGDLVGLDIDLVQHLARELDVSIDFVPVASGGVGAGFAADHFDVAVGAIPSSIRNLDQFAESDLYLDLHAALVVRDHRVKEFKTLERILAADRLRIACVEGGLLVRTDRESIPGLEVVLIPSAEVFLGDEDGGLELDALLTTAESGSIYTMIKPEFAVVIPEGVRTRVPIVFAVQRSPELERVVSTWLRLKREDGTVDELYDHWILGKTAAKKKPRWSVIRDVFGWVK